MWRNILDYGAGIAAGGAGITVFFYIAFYWRATCRWIDKWEARRSRFWGHSEKYIAFNTLLTPPYLVSVMVFLLVGGIALLVICGTALINPPHPDGRGVLTKSPR